jgi:hypothetical protein
MMVLGGRAVSYERGTLVGAVRRMRKRDSLLIQEKPKAQPPNAEISASSAPGSTECMFLVYLQGYTAHKKRPPP